jgi:glycosyltransferase involved in cell wall biosynthesis
VADDLLVLHHGGASLAPDGKPNPVKEEHERMLAARYPYYHDMVRALEQDVTGPLARSLSAARRALKQLSVVIDARILAGPMTGTQLHVLELIAAVARRGEVRVTALLPLEVSSYVVAVLDTLPDVRQVRMRSARTAPIERQDIVHRPFQVSGPYDLTLLAQLGDRLVVTHQDLIGYRNPSYFHSFGKWEDYRRLTRRALAVADQTIFFSAHARADAIAEDLIEPHRASVVHIGVDHTLAKIAREPVAPRGASRLPADAELIVCLGTDFRHKNRVFALRLLDELQRRHEWNGRLVFVGPRVECGSSAPDEDELLVLAPRVGDSVVDLAAVEEEEKAWLLHRARLVLYPTVYEGFGLVPFEAADYGVPCLWAEGTSLSEILPDSAAGIVPWDAAASADRALELLRDEAARERNIAAIRAAAAQLTWDASAARLLDVYRAVCDEPPSPTSALERAGGLMHEGVSEDALRLVGPDGMLPRDVERPLLALASHPQIGSPVFRAIKAGYRASYRWRRSRPGRDGVDG